MIIYWHKRDLRLNDNQALTTAVTLSLEYDIPFVPIMGLESDLIQGIETAYEFGRFYQHGFVSGLLPLCNNYQYFGIAPLVFNEPVVEYLKKIHKSEPITHLVSHQEHGTSGTYKRDKLVQQFCNQHSIQWIQLQPSSIKRNLKDRNLRDKLSKEYLNVPPLGLPNFALVKSFKDTELFAQTHKNLQEFEILKEQLGSGLKLKETSEKAGLEVLKEFTTTRAAGYRGGISSPNTAILNGSRLSQFLAFGSLSLRYVYQFFWKQIKETSDKKLKSGILGAMKRLYWREHFIQRLETDSTMPDHSINPQFDTIKYAHNPEYFIAFKTGTTGEVMIDACIRCLNKTGFINFRMRSLLVSYATFGLDLDWRIVGRFLATIFYDYEPGIHWSQVHMQAGVTGINTIRVYSPSKQLLDQDPDCKFVSEWIPELQELSIEQIQDYQSGKLFELTNELYPNPVVDFKTESKANKLKTFGVRKNSSKEISKAVYIKHGSRKKPIKKKAKVVKADENSLFN
jgi:deoxyribodipyrimidine photo-lyase